MNAPPIPSGSTALEWTPELIARFWDNSANTQEMRDIYFTHLFGEEIVRLLGAIGDLKGKQILDYGCGPGYLVGRLLAEGALVTGADYSSASVERANTQFAGKPGWQGAIQIDSGALPLPDGQIDLITCVETIEHMFDPARAAMLAEFRRVLKPGGRVFFTAPNEENLRESFVYCPNCSHEFHKMQHMSTWNASKLTTLLEANGFKVEFCRGVMLERWGKGPRKGAIDLSLRDILQTVRRSLGRLIGGMADAMAPRPFPNGRVFQQRANSLGGRNLVAVARAD